MDFCTVLLTREQHIACNTSTFSVYVKVRLSTAGPIISRPASSKDGRATFITRTVHSLLVTTVDRLPGRWFITRTVRS